VKRLCADDSAATSVKVGHRQAFIPHSPVFLTECGAFAFARQFLLCASISYLQFRSRRAYHAIAFLSTHYIAPFYFLSPSYLTHAMIRTCLKIDFADTNK
jgi:hypothetical protein